MRRIAPATQDYDWGSTTSIPDMKRELATGGPIAELWYGAHTRSPSRVSNGENGLDLRQYIASDPEHLLGRDIVERFGAELPFLLKLIAPAKPLSLQVHPSAEEAALGWVREQRSGVPIDAPHRTYRDHNHKPEMVYALTEFEAVSGFRAPRRALEVLAGLEDIPLVAKTVERLHHGASSQGMRSAFEYMLLGARDRDSDVHDVVERISARLARDASPSAHSDSIALRVAEHHPGDRGILATLLLNPVTLSPGEAMFVPAGCAHAYLSGLAVEVMASSDNVVRAGLTSKYVDARTLLDIVDVRPAPPIRLAPERSKPGVEVFYAPVEEFELAVITAAPHLSDVGGRGPRIVMAIEGDLEVVCAGSAVTLAPTQAIFLSATDVASVRGAGRVVRASVP